jgi:hypothetical protein
MSNINLDYTFSGMHPGWHDGGWHDSRSFHHGWQGNRTAHLDADTVLSWNQHTLDAIQASGSTPLSATRALAMESIAVFDVLNAIDNAPAYMVDLDAPHAISATAAVAAAAHRILTYTFPTQTAAFDSDLAQSLATVPDGARERAGVAPHGAWLSPGLVAAMGLGDTVRSGQR